MNSNLKKSQGRRMPKEKCVKNPQIQEISHCLQALHIRHVIEPHKRHTRDFEHFGRLKIEIFDELGYPKNKEITSKKVVMRKVLELLPKLVSRQEGKSPEEPKYILGSIQEQ
mmetsp:Transcript_26659/g.19983  ORF Transcript_26659/g.19983 Transcript_26659/m.19983 type:complete len:112 (-) Transcript_26659:70-405(-)